LTPFGSQDGDCRTENSISLAVDEIAAAEKFNTSYVSRVVRLTLLAPDIVEAIQVGRQLADTTHCRTD
jgi:hypothetical protein